VGTAAAVDIAVAVDTAAAAVDTTAAVDTVAAVDTAAVAAVMAVVAVDMAAAAAISHLLLYHINMKLCIFFVRASFNTTVLNCCRQLSHFCIIFFTSSHKETNLTLYDALSAFLSSIFISVNMLPVSLPLGFLPSVGKR
jgi:hypothetical protein